MPPNSRTKISSNSKPLGKVLETLSSEHPFVQQLDVILPDDHILVDTLSRLRSTYRRGQADLFNVLEASYSLNEKYTSQSGLVALSLGSLDTEDVWCIDNHGTLTLFLTKETYYELGLIGEKLSKKTSERFGVKINLYDRDSKLFARAKREIQNWDKRRHSQGFGPWKIITQGSPDILQAHVDIEIKPLVTQLSDVVIPQWDLEGLNANSTKSTQKDEAIEDIQERVSEIYEWIGLTCLRSDRIKAYDRVDPYIAVYEPPEPNTVGDVVHIRWHGLLSPDFVGNILKVIAGCIENKKNVPSFVSITANTMENAPLTYIPGGAPARNKIKLPLRCIHCWSLIAEPPKGRVPPYILSITDSIKG